jgi:hypothetical protein
MTKSKSKNGSDSSIATNKDRGLRPTTSETPMPTVKPPKSENSNKQG